jgi:NADH-quinone oxidoreductase subunit C
MTTLTPEKVLERIHAALPGAGVELIPNPSPCGQHSLLVPREDAVEVARFLKNDPELQLDYASNVSGVDQYGFLEVVYHLYSVTKKHGPIVLRTRTAGRDANASVPSLTPVYRSAEFQEREVYDLFGVHFEGHPDLRRILMWDEFEDYPMRKDYVAQ